MHNGPRPSPWLHGGQPDSDQRPARRPQSSPPGAPGTARNQAPAARSAVSVASRPPHGRLRGETRPLDPLSGILSLTTEHPPPGGADIPKTPSPRFPTPTRRYNGPHGPIVAAAPPWSPRSVLKSPCINPQSRVYRPPIRPPQLAPTRRRSRLRTARAGAGSAVGHSPVGGPRPSSARGTAQGASERSGPVARPLGRSAARCAPPAGRTPSSPGAPARRRPSAGRVAIDVDELAGACRGCAGSSPWRRPTAWPLRGSSARSRGSRRSAPPIRRRRAPKPGLAPVPPRTLALAVEVAPQTGRPPPARAGPATRAASWSDDRTARSDRMPPAGRPGGRINSRSAIRSFPATDVVVTDHPPTGGDPRAHPPEH